MKSDFFIDRPVFSTVLSVVIVIVGLLGLVMLPVDQYPRIVPPVVKISASYPGASAQTVTQAVATPIEQELNGTPGMLYMESTSSNSGGFSATVTFDIDTDADLAAVEIQNRVKQAEARLPAEVIQNGISVEKQASSRLMTITLLSNDPKFDEIYLSNYATLNVLDMLRRVKGVGSVSNVGSRYYAMQIWVQPDRLANLGLTVQDLQKALKDQNRESAAGVLGQQPITDLDVTIPITARGRLSSVGEFEEIVVRANPDGSLIRLRDVARISLEASSYSTESGINGGNAAVMNINMLPGANAMEVARSVRETMEEISRSFPEGISYKIPFDMTSYISQSIREVYHTLFEALLLVILVVFLSLQNWRATLIPTIAVPISLIGTFGVMLAFGFSLNMMTLLGLILAIGIVVDDAIVVVEAVERIMNEEGLSPYEATKKAMSGLGSAIIATSLVLCAVFVPVSFLSGITGQLYRQFTITIAVSVLISTFVALTLSPAFDAAATPSRRAAGRAEPQGGDGLGGHGLCRPVPAADDLADGRARKRRAQGTHQFALLLRRRQPHRAAVRLRIEACEIPRGAGGLRPGAAGLRTESAGGFPRSERRRDGLPQHAQDGRTEIQPQGGGPAIRRAGQIAVYQRRDPLHRRARRPAEVLRRTGRGEQGGAQRAPRARGVVQGPRGRVAAVGCRKKGLTVMVNPFSSPVWPGCGSTTAA